jgi:hypothetical protein
MRLPGFVFSIIIILIAFALLTLLLPSKVTVAKSVLINAPAEAVRNEIVDLKNWKDWYPAFENKKVRMEIDSSNRSAAPSLILKDEAGKKLRFYFTEIKKDTIQIRVISSTSAAVNYQFILTPHSDAQTQLTWNVNLFMEWYPWAKIKGIFLDKISGPQFEFSLNQMKKVLEKSNS